MQRLAQASCRRIRDSIRNSGSFFGWPNNRTKFGYDLLDRVTTGTSSALSRGYTYDANGNRSAETGTVTYTATIASMNNQIASITGGLARTYTYDSAGNTKSYTGATFTFNDRGRMSSAAVSGGTTDYVYNALGQLIEKSGYEGTTLLLYDEAGRLLGEYSSTGALIQETVWLGNIPVATLRPNGSSVTVYYVHADHLGTPRKITNPSGNTVVWRWDPDTYGTAAPSINTIAYNLRFPGQYYLPETGLNYNYFRTYDPQTGRYLESDPIGLNGGNSTYAYAKDNPLSSGDPFGLFSLGFNVTEIPTFFVTNGDDGHTTSSVTHYKCTCMRVSCQWKLQECSGILQVNVEIQRLLFPLSKQIARAYEQQHVNDYAAARSAMEADLTQREQVLKNNLYRDEQTCAASAKAALEPFVLQWQINIAKLSYDKYDYPGGPHNH